MNDYEQLNYSARVEALSQANRESGLHAREVVERAQAFYDFLTEPPRAEGE